jgi:ATP-dependent DNA helicase RecG
MSDPQTAELPTPRFDDDLVAEVLEYQESTEWETKRAGDVSSALRTIVALANTRGGWLVLGIEDPKKASGRDRLFGVQERAEAVAELRRGFVTRITPPLCLPDRTPPDVHEIGCTLRDGAKGSIVLVHVRRSGDVHSVVDGGTFVRVGSTNRQISAAEINDLCMKRGVVSAADVLTDVDSALLDTVHWREYAAKRRLTRPIEDAMAHLGLVRKNEDGHLRPTRAAVLLFAEDPAGVLRARCSVRVFHYRGDKVEHKADTNLLRPPQTFSGPLIEQIREAADATVHLLAKGVQMGPLGFEIAQKYPVRVVREAITNAVIHRDYRIPADIQVRIFANRIEVESPGTLPADVTVRNIGFIGSRPRNLAIVNHLREFPNPPNLDAGEGVRMMRQQMGQANLYPPVYVTEGDLQPYREAVVVHLFNEARPTVWDQVEAYLRERRDVGNAEVRKILGTEDTLKASRMLRSWVARGLLEIVNPQAAKQHRRYALPGMPKAEDLLSKVERKDAP